jgi:hypothetical protein
VLVAQERDLRRLIACDVAGLTARSTRPIRLLSACASGLRSFHICS